MVLRINKKRVVVAVKEKQRLEAGEEMRVWHIWLDKGGMDGDSGEGCKQ